jgi:hypothetical protein
MRGHSLHHDLIIECVARFVGIHLATQYRRFREMTRRTASLAHQMQKAILAHRPCSSRKLRRNPHPSRTNLRTLRLQPLILSRRPRRCVHFRIEIVPPSFSALSCATPRHSPRYRLPVCRAHLFDRTSEQLILISQELRVRGASLVLRHPECDSPLHHFTRRRRAPKASRKIPPARDRRCVLSTSAAEIDENRPARILIESSAHLLRVRADLRECRESFCRSLRRSGIRTPES